MADAGALTTAMRILLLGGTGFIGSSVVRRLLLGGHEVAVVHRGHHPAPPGARSFLADRRRLDSLAAAMASFHTEALVDMVAYAATDVDRVLPALAPELCRITLISSGDVYAAYGAFLGHEPPPPGHAATPETGALRASRYPYRDQASDSDDLRYDYDKILVEEAYRARSPVPVTILRLPMVYGPGDPHRRLDRDLARLHAAAGRVLQMHPEEAAWRCTRGFVDDVAAAIALATVHPQSPGRTYNVGEVEALSSRAWLAALAQASAVEIEIQESLTAAPSHPARWTVPLVTATDRIRNELGYTEPVGRVEGLRLSVSAAAA